MGKKYEDKGGRIKDYLKGIISLAGGVLLVILGIVWLEILPLAIVLFVIGVPAVFTGIGLIIHNKKNNTHYMSDSPSSSSGSSSSSSPANMFDWGYKFKEVLEDIRYNASAVSVYTTVSNGVIDVQATIEPNGAAFACSEEANARLAASNYEATANIVKSAYQKVAKKCPYSSQLSVRRK